jgi:hypothetical protein
MRIESRRGQNEEKWKKTHFAIRKHTFFLLLFKDSPLALHLKDDL